MYREFEISKLTQDVYSRQYHFLGNLVFKSSFSENFGASYFKSTIILRFNWRPVR